MIGCQAGSIREAARTQSMRAVNFVRALAGLDPVTYSDRYNAKAQKAALVYQAKGEVSHQIPTDWPCYSPDAARAATHSNLSPDAAGADAVPLYMTDEGAQNVAAGHRRWILNPATRVMGNGSAGNVDVLWVIGRTAKKYADPSWVSWPTPGYFPQQLEPLGRWSLSGDSTHDYDFSGAHVRVTAKDGTKLPVTVQPQIDGYGSDTLVWQVSGLAPTGSYRVSVKGIERDGKTVSRSYTVKLFNPDAP